MTLPAGLNKYRGKKQNTSSDKSDKRIYIRYFSMPAAKGLDDITGLSRGDLMPEETNIYVLSVKIVNDTSSQSETVEIIGYKNKEWA